MVKNFVKLLLIVSVFANASEEMNDLAYQRLISPNQEKRNISEFFKEDTQAKDIVILQDIISQETIDNNIKLFYLSKDLWINTLVMVEISNEKAKKLRCFSKNFSKCKKKLIKDKVSDILYTNKERFNFNSCFTILGLTSTCVLLVEISNSRKDNFGNLIEFDKTYALAFSNSFANLTQEEEDFVRALNKHSTYYDIAVLMNKSYKQFVKFIKTFRKTRPEDYKIIEHCVLDFGDENDDCSKNCCVIS